MILRIQADYLVKYRQLRATCLLNDIIRVESNDKGLAAYLHVKA